MANFFERRDPWGHGMALWVLTGMMFLTPLAWWSVKQIDLENDVENWLPADDPQAKVLAWYRTHFPAGERILVSWKGSSLDDPRISRLKTLLEGTETSDGGTVHHSSFPLRGRFGDGVIRRGGSKQVASVVTPQDVIRRMVEHGVDRDDAIRRLQGVLVGKGELMVRLTDFGRNQRRQSVQMMAEHIRSRLGIEVEILDVGIAEETASDSGELAVRAGRHVDDEFEPETGVAPLVESHSPYDQRISWPRMHWQPAQVEQVVRLLKELESASADGPTNRRQIVAESRMAAGSPVALAVNLSEAGAADASGTLAVIRQAALQAGIPEDDLAMGGGLVAGSALNQAVKKAAWNRDVPLSRPHQRSVLLFAGIMAVGLAFLMLRSVQLAVLVIFVACYTTFLAVAAVPVTNGSMNMVLVVMPTLLSVVTISAAIHVANYWKHAAHKCPQTAVVEATRTALRPCVLASVTTAIGLVSLATSPLAPVRDFGLYSALGCLLSLGVVLLVLPALLQYWPARVPAVAEIDRTGWQRMGGFLARHRKAVTGVSLLLGAICTCGLYRFQTETKVIRYFPDSARVVRDYRFIEENLAGIVPVETVVRFHVAAQRQLNFLERMELVRGIQQKIRQHPEISGCLSLADFQPVSEPPGADATLLQTVRFNKRASVVEQRVKSGKQTAARNFLAVAEASNDPRNDHPPESVGGPGEELWRITAQVAIMSDLNYADVAGELDEMARSVLGDHPGVDHVITGSVPLFLRTQQAVLESLVLSFGLAFGVIALVMMVLLKNPVAGLLTMLPNVLPVGIVFGLISWSGMAVDIGTMITASVALGIAVDGTLHLLTWFRAGLTGGLSRGEAISKALAHCGPAMWQTSAVVGIGLLMLSPAELLLISRFGWLMAALIAAALAGDLVLLPALLAGTLGRMIEKTVTAKKPQPPSPQPRIHAPKPHLYDMPATSTPSNRTA